MRSTLTLTKSTQLLKSKLYNACQREEAVTKAKIQSFRSGVTAWPWRRHMKEKEKRVDRFNTGDISLKESLPRSNQAPYWTLVGSM